MADSHTEAHGDGHHGDDHHAHGGLGKYAVVFVCLCALTMCSFLTVQDWWPFAKAPTWIFMMGVSTVKAMLVILVFMHLLWEANWKYVLTIPAGMMSVFLVLMLIPDIGNRMSKYSEERTIHAAEIVEEVEGGHGHADGHAEDGHATDQHAGDEHGGGH